MSKKRFCFPFIDGSLQEWSPNILMDDEVDRVYNGERIVKIGRWRNEEEWRPAEDMELTLHYQGFARGSSSVTYLWKDDEGHVYPMFITDFNDMFIQGGGPVVHGIFRCVKRGANYGIKFIKKVDA